MTSRDNDDRRAIRSALLLASIGIEMAVAVVIGWYIGDTLDKWFETNRIMTIIFISCGVSAGILSLYRSAKKHWPR